MPKPKNDSDRDSKVQAAWIAAIVDPNRMAILRVLVTGTYSVTKLAKACDMEVVNVSHHLGILRDAGLVSFERDGRFVCYSLVGAIATATMLELVHESGIKVSIPLG